jgi:hypothetical protein
VASNTIIQRAPRSKEIVVKITTMTQIEKKVQAQQQQQYQYLDISPSIIVNQED